MKRIRIKHGAVVVISFAALFAAVACGSDDEAISVATSVPPTTSAPVAAVADAMSDDDKMSDDAMMADEVMKSDDDKKSDDAMMADEVMKSDNDKMADEAMMADDDKNAADAMMTDDKKADGAMMTDDAVMSDDDKKSSEAMVSDDAMMVDEDHEFTVRIENISSGASVPSPLAPGAYVIHSSADPIFTPGKVDRGEGLEGLAEDGGGDALAAAIAGNDGVSAAVGFATTVNTGEPGPALPGDSYEFTFTANSGDRLSFATMFVQSNDLFFASPPGGILFWDEDGMILDGDITSQIMLWDAGTEVNEEPGVGPNQAPRQSAAGEGTQESSAINLVSDGYTYPDTNTVIKVTITSTK